MQIGAAAGQKECVRVVVWIVTRAVHAAKETGVARFGGPRLW